LLLLFAWAGVKAQEPSSLRMPIDGRSRLVEYGNIRFRDEKAMLDRWASRFRLEPGNSIYILVYAGRHTCVGEAEARATRAKSYLVKRHGIGADRVIWKVGGFRERLSVDLWLWPRDESPPLPSPTVDPTDVKFVDSCRPGRRGARSKS
jgi:hypothetical protein